MENKYRDEYELVHKRNRIVQSKLVLTRELVNVMIEALKAYVKVGNPYKFKDLEK